MKSAGVLLFTMTTDHKENFIQEYLEQTRSLLHGMEGYLTRKISRLGDILLEARARGNTIFIMGNGGSASTASHFVNDLAKWTIVEGAPRFRVIGLTDNISVMLAWANDSSYEYIFVEQLKNLMQGGDVVIGLSGSGNSPNVVRAIEYANASGGITIGISGYDGGKLLSAAKENIHIPTFDMQKAENMHLIILHLVVALIKEELLRN